MGLFGSNNDKDEQEEATGIQQRVETTVEDLRSGQSQQADIVGRLDTSHEDHLVAARALVRVALYDLSAVEDVADEAINRLAERELARPVAESLLHSTENLRTNGLDYATVAEGSIDALNEALNRIQSVRTEHPQEVLGGGASEIALATELREHANSVQGRQQMVVEATADAFESVPRDLARQAEMDPIDTLVEMRTKHELDDTVGVGVMSGELRDAQELAVDEREVERRLTDGVALAGIVALTKGTVTQLGTLTGHKPYPV